MIKRLFLALAGLGLACLFSAPSASPTLAQDVAQQADLEGDGVPGADQDQSLSEQLDEDEGVIEPPPVGDHEIDVPAPEPDPGTTVVIPPPGEPGGDQSVQPK